MMNSENSYEFFRDNADKLSKAYKEGCKMIRENMEIIVDFKKCGFNYRAPYVKVREKLKVDELGVEIVAMLDDVYHKEVEDAENKSIMISINTAANIIGPRLMYENYIDYMDTILSKSLMITDRVTKAIVEVNQEDELDSEEDETIE